GARARSARRTARDARGGCRPGPPKTRIRTRAARGRRTEARDPWLRSIDVMQQFTPVPPPRRIVALGGGGFSRFGRYSKLDDYILSLAQKDHPRVMYLGTAGGDSDAHIVLFYEAFAGRARPSHL